MEASFVGIILKKQGERKHFFTEKVGKESERWPARLGSIFGMAINQTETGPPGDTNDRDFLSDFSFVFKVKTFGIIYFTTWDFSCYKSPLLCGSKTVRLGFELCWTVGHPVPGRFHQS